MKTVITVWTENGPKRIEADLIGPFAVHRLSHDCYVDGAKWGVTHKATGFSAATGPTKACCMHAARALRNVHVDWNFDKSEAVKGFGELELSQIGVIRAACAQGGEA